MNNDIIVVCSVVDLLVIAKSENNIDVLKGKVKSGIDDEGLEKPTLFLVTGMKWFDEEVHFDQKILTNKLLNETGMTIPKPAKSPTGAKLETKDDVVLF